MTRRRAQLPAEGESVATTMRCPRCYRYGAPTATVVGWEYLGGWDFRPIMAESGRARDVVVDPHCLTCGGTGSVPIEVRRE